MSAKKYLGLPPSLRKLIKQHEKKFVANSANNLGTYFETKKLLPITYSSLKEVSKAYSIKYKNPVFIFVPNTKGLFYPIMKVSSSKVKLNLLTKTKKYKDDEYYFLDEPMVSTTRIANTVERAYHEYIGTIDSSVCKFYLSRELKSMTRLHAFEGIEIPIRAMQKTMMGRVPVSEYCYLVNKVHSIPNDYSPVEKAIPFIKSIDDLALIWNHEDNKAMYSKIENYLILINLAYVEYGVPALNLILCGKGGTKKTAWLEMLSTIFQEDNAMMTLSTRKGLVPSFYGESVKSGLLLNAKFVALVDDFFRSFSQHAVGSSIKHEIHRGLEQLMNLLDRRHYIIPSGKKDLSVQFKSAFFATDNYSYPLELAVIGKTDQPVLRRYTFVRLSQQSEVDSIGVNELNSEEAITMVKRRLSRRKLSFARYKLLFEFLRENVKKAEYDKKKFKKIVSKHRHENFYVESKARALIKGVVLLNTIMRSDALPTKFVATKTDYELFEELLNRVIVDFKSTLIV